jgi:hypothetical protein
LTPEVLESIRAELRGVWARSQRLSRFPLRNGDEPAIRFRA